MRGRKIQLFFSVLYVYIFMCFFIEPKTEAKFEFKSESKRDTSDCKTIFKLKQDLYHRPKPRLVFIDNILNEKGFKKYIGEAAVLIDNNSEGDFNKKEVSVEFQVFKSNSKTENKPTLVLLPGLFGITFLDEHIAMYFANQGYHVIVTHYRDTSSEFDINSLSSLWTNNIIATTGVIDSLLDSFPELNRTQMALMGYSFGGLRAAFLAAVDYRFKAVNIMVSSGSLSETLAYSNKDFIVELRTKHMQTLGLSRKSEYASYLRSKQPFEPISALCLPDYSHYYLVISKQDEWIPSPLQEQFQKKLTGSKVTVYDEDHVSSVLNYAMINLRKTLEFFKSRGIHAT